MAGCPALGLGSDRYDASEWRASIMSLAIYMMPAFECVEQKSRNCFTFSLSCCVAVDCREAMELRVAVIVGLLAREYHTKVPMTSWM